MRNLILLCCTILVTLLSSFSTHDTETFKITGVVSDSEGVPLIGCSINEKGTNNGTITDFDGSFWLTVSSIKAQIEVSYTGYDSKFVTLKAGKKDYKIILKEGMLLDEVVVSSHSISAKVQNFFSGAKNRNSYKSESIRENYGSPENYKYFEDNGFKSTNIDPLNTMSIDVDRASYSNVRRFLNSDQMPPKDAVLIEEMINYFDYKYEGPNHKDKHPIRIQSTYTECPWNPDHQLLHVAMKAKSLDRTMIPSSNLVFLLDVSGSMNSPNKLPLLKQSFKLLTENLTEKDRVSIVVYAGAAGVIVEGLSGDDKPAIYEALDRLEAGGSTAGAAGIRKAYKLAKKYYIEAGNNRVILATDGDFNVGQSSEGDLVRLIQEKKESGVFLSILGFGVGNYQESKMQELAQEGNGNHFYIDDIQEAQKSLVTEFGSTIYAVAKDVKLQIEFNPSKVAGYRVIGYENRQLEHEEFNDDTKDAGDLGAGHNVTVIYEIIPAGSKSAFIPKVDALKYGQNKSNSSSELATLKCRYKPIDKKESIKFEHQISTKRKDFNKISDPLQWSIAVTEFGMLLRNSPYKANASYNHTLAIMNKANPNIYQKECIELVKKAQKLDRDLVID